MQKSLTSFIRQQLKVKGTSAHNGRGATEMEGLGISYNELEARLNKLIPKWHEKGLIDTVEPDGSIRFTQSNFGWVRHFTINTNFGNTYKCGSTDQLLGYIS